MLKSEIRSLYKARRKSLSPKELQKQSEQITELFLKNFQVENKWISIFLPIERLGEVNTYSLLDRASNLGAKMCVPSSNFSDLSLTHKHYDANTILRLNEFDIPEPLNGNIIQPEEFDMVIVPLLGVDKNGFRVGYGKGFYDRFLSQCKPNCIFIGFHLFEIVAEITDKSSQDIPLDCLVTPHQIIHFKHSK